jgi:IS605 OrfB family transposase
VIDDYHRSRLNNIRGQADLIYLDGQFYLGVVVEVPEPTPLEPNDWLSVDLGIINLAADSDGDMYSGGKVNGIRERHAKLRQRLQKKNTKSSKRLLKKRSEKESRFATDVNRQIAKRLATKAKDTGRGIALENLAGIRDRITVKTAQRRVQHSWAFYQLRSLIQDKARLARVPVLLVDPRNTSRTCPNCGVIDKRNRPDQAHLRCMGCGFAGPADTIAAGNIARLAAVNQPNAGSTIQQIPASPVL